MHEFPEFIKSLPELDIPFDGVSGHLLQGESQQVAFVSFEKDTNVPEHSHRAQWEHVIEGKMVLRMNGEARTYWQGESFFIPEGVKHGAHVMAGYRAIICFDQADRYQPR
jgi:quercetin dioxygenase-like cupin family protein